MSVLAHREAWTFDELADLPDTGERYEVVDGNLIVTPPPSHDHQLVISGLFHCLHAGCRPPWRVVTDFGLRLGTDGRVPDLALIRTDAPRASGTRYPFGPDAFGLVVEVVSPRSRKTDRFLKPAEYGEAAIQIYWRVELEPELEIHGYALRDGVYVPVQGALPVPWGSIEIDLAALLSP